MTRYVLIIAALLLIVTGCGGRQQASAPTSTPSTSPAPAAETAPRAIEGGLPPYPGAKQTSSSSFSGAGPTGTTGQWTTTTLETTDPYEKVRDFYKASTPKGFAQSFTTEQSEDSGHIFTLWFARADGKAWHTIAVKEEKADGKVVITAASGSAP